MIFFVVMHLPDPTPSSDGHYKPFAEIFGKETSENHRPPLQKKPKKDDSSIPRCITTCQECKHDVGMRRMWNVVLTLCEEQSYSWLNNSPAASPGHMVVHLCCAAARSQHNWPPGRSQCDKDFLILLIPTPLVFFFLQQHPYFLFIF